MMGDDDFPECPECGEELDWDDYCDQCDRTWSQEELDEHMEKECESYIAFMKKINPEMFGEVE
ncbi:SAM--benzoic acid carboxyl methyltransferase [Enterococcus sp. LJL99]